VSTRDHDQIIEAALHARTLERRWSGGEYLVRVVIAVALIAAVVVGVVSYLRQDQIASASDRRDCVTSISTARRSVFDDVDIYKAIEIDQLARALINSQSGVRASADDVAAFTANEQLLSAALVEARRLQPAKVLDHLIAHGGLIDGVHYDACPS
jgi:uncharacterized membrane protein